MSERVEDMPTEPYKMARTVNEYVPTQPKLKEVKTVTRQPRKSFPKEESICQHDYTMNTGAKRKTSKQMSKLLEYYQYYEGKWDD